MPYLYLFISGGGWEVGGLRGPQGERNGVPDPWISKKSGHSVSLAPTPLGLSMYYLLNNYFLCWGGEGEGKEAWVFVQKCKKPL